MATTIKHLTRETFIELPIPFPPLEKQREIIANFRREEAMLAGVAELAKKFEAKIAARLSAIWGAEEIKIVKGGNK